MTKSDDKKVEAKQGNSSIILVIILLIAGAVGAGAYFSGMIETDNSNSSPQEVAQSEPLQQDTEEMAAAETSVSDEANSDEMDASEMAAQIEPAAGEEASEDAKEGEESRYVIEPGNPTIAKLNGEEIKRTDLYRFMQQMGPQIQGQNMEKLYPVVQEQLINNQLVSGKVKDVDLSKDDQYKSLLDEAKENIKRQVFLQNEIDSRLTEDRIKKEYDAYVKAFPETMEMKAWHILVDDEATAKEVIEKLNKGSKFEDLAKEYSKDSSAAKGGELEYFAKGEVVPEFSDAAFALKEGDYTKEPVKSQFGYHVIKAGDQKKRDPVDYETAKPQISQQLRSVLLSEILADWREKADVKLFDINGKEVEPAAGE